MDPLAQRLAAAVPERAHTPALRALRRAWSRTVKAEAAEAILVAAEALAGVLPQERKWLAYELIRFHPAAYAALDRARVQRFAADIASWYATDAFGTVLTGPLWAKWRLPDDLFEAWSRAPSRWLRRSALVATVGLNARGSGGEGDAGRTLPLCLTLVGDRDDMVEKALSWALRVLSQRDRPAVETFLAQHEAVLAARVKRELRHKLATGVKTPRRR